MPAPSKQANKPSWPAAKGAYTLHSLFDRYVGREITGAFAAGLGLFLAVVSFGQLLKLMDGGQALGLGSRELLLAALFAMPPILSMLLPIAWLYACLLAIGRLSQDREVLALAQAGVGYVTLLRVPVRGGLLLAIVAMLLAGFGEPWGVCQLSNLLAHSAQRALTQGLSAGTFHGVGGGLTLFAEARQGPVMQGLLLADRRAGQAPLTVQAARAEARPGRTAHEVLFCLKDGTLVLGADRPLEDGRRFVRFAEGSYRLDASALVRAGRRSFTDDQGLSLADLWQRSRAAKADDPSAAQLRITLQRKLSLPLAAPIFGALAVPLGLGARGAARARSLLYSSLIVGAYYYLGRSLELSARHGAVSPWLAAWLPDALGLVALGLAFAWLHWRRA